MTPDPSLAVDDDGALLRYGRLAPALILDLDGTVRRHKDDPEGFINPADDVALFPDVEEKAWAYRDAGHLVLGVSNQGGVAFGHKTPESFWAELEAMSSLWERGDPFHLIKASFHHPGGNVVPYCSARSLLRKPSHGMLALMELELFQEGYVVDWDRSLFVGDRPEDQKCAEGAGIRFEWAAEFFGREQ